MITDIIQQFLEWLTLLGGLFVIFAICLWIYSVVSGRKEARTKISLWISRNYLWLGFIVALVATSGSLFYSEVMGYTPCVLCWWQRIFMYSQVLLFGVALWAKDKSVARYSFFMSIIGGLISAYHYSSQVGFITSDLPCSAIGYSASCSTLFFVALGYITIPMMALTAFAMLIIFALNSRAKNGVVYY